MKKRTFGTAAALLSAGFLATPAFAGPPPAEPEAPVPPPPPAPEHGYLWDEVNATLSAGWDYEYVWRGIDFGENLIWSDVNIDFDLDDEGDVVLNLGAWYADTHDSGPSEIVDQELDLYTGVTIGLGPVDLNFGYIFYYFDDDSDQYHEGYLGLATSWEFLSFGLTGFYEFETESWYAQFTVESTFELTDWLDLILAGVISYSDGEEGYYLLDDGDIHHGGLSAALAVHLTPTATLTPYLAYAHQFDALGEGDAFGQSEDKFYGGVKLSVTF